MSEKKNSREIYTSLRPHSPPLERARQSQAGAIADKADQRPKKAIRVSKSLGAQHELRKQPDKPLNSYIHIFRRHHTKMGLIGPYTLIRAISVFHITVAWFFLTAPRRVVDQNVVFMLGESMRLVSYTQPFKAYTEHD